MESGCFLSDFGTVGGGLGDLYKANGGGQVLMANKLLVF